jgi:hypothetical protein
LGIASAKALFPRINAGAPTTRQKQNAIIRLLGQISYGCARLLPAVYIYK